MTADRESGFSLIELLIVVAILGLIVSIAAPKLLEARTQAAASRVLADVDLIHMAVLAYRLDNSSYPATAGWGTVPPVLEPYLPANFSFVNGDVRYRYQLRNRAKRLGVDGGGANSKGRDIVVRVGEMFMGRKAVTARRAWLWLPSPGGRRE